jgi:glycosyltransferase involved in cell wall biosynthesis
VTAALEGRSHRQPAETQDELNIIANERSAGRRTETPASGKSSIVPAAATSCFSVDVCVTSDNQGAYLPFLLDSIAHQTSQDFSLYVVDDGATDASSVATFEHMRSMYDDPRWHFVRSESANLSAARNRAAALGTGEYLLFVDADNVAAPQMVDRFLSAIRLSGDDCLTSYLLQFDGEGWDESYLQSPPSVHTPTGNSLLLGLTANEFGDASCIIRRSVFEALGGFATDPQRSRAGEEWEFFTRLAFAGYRLDVIPEYLVYDRIRHDGHGRSTEMYLTYMRVLRVYDEHLSQVGLSGLAEYVAGAYNQVIRQVPEASGEDMQHLVNHVSGYLVAKALALKLRNQLIRRLTGRTEF